MKKLSIFLPIIIFTLSFLALANPTSAETIVSKDITMDTTWIVANSPYTLTKRIKIESANTLTIEPGVTVQMPGGYDEMFLLEGEIQAIGTAENPIIFDGGGNSIMFNAKNSRVEAFINLDNCVIKNGTTFWQGGFGYFSLKNSTVENFSQRSYLESPKNDVYIEYNEFKNIAGLSIKQGDTNKVYIRYNLFDTKNPNLASYENYLIENTASYNDSATIIEYNTFLNIEGVALKLPTGQASASLSAPNNYWGTADESEIADMIYDKNDNASSAGYIEYQPILTEAHADTRGTVVVVDEETPPADETPNEDEVPVVNETPSEVPPTDETPVEGDIPDNTNETGSTGQTEEKINAFVAEEKGLASAVDNALTTRLTGRILLQVENHGEAWYINPADSQKYYMANGEKAYNIMRFLGVGITNTDLTKIQADKNFAKKHSGKIFLQVEAHGEAFYIDIDGNAHYLKDGSAAYTIMRDLGLGITNEDVRKIEVGEIK